MIGKIVRIGHYPSDLMLVERALPGNTRFYGLHCRGHQTSASEKEIALRSEGDIETWNLWAEVRQKNILDYYSQTTEIKP